MNKNLIKWKNPIAWVLDSVEMHQKRNYSINVFDNSSLKLTLNNITSNEIGIITCKCLFCEKPVFSITEVSFL